MKARACELVWFQVSLFNANVDDTFGDLLKIMIIEGKLKLAQKEARNNYKSSNLFNLKSVV